jgi:hypothetical protein
MIHTKLEDYYQTQIFSLSELKMFSQNDKNEKSYFEY